MSRSARIRLGAGLVFALTASTALASPREDLVRAWLTGSTFGLPVTIGQSGYDPATQSVVFSDVTIGGDATLPLKVHYDNLTVEDPRRTPAGDFAAHAVRFGAITVTVRLDPEAWFPDFAALDKAMKSDTAPAPGTATEAPASKAPAPEFTFTLESGLYERFVAPFATPAVDPKASTFDKIGKFADYWRALRVDWYEFNGLAYDIPVEGGGTAKVGYDLIYASGVHDGRIERTGINGITETIPVEDGKTATFTIDQARIVGYDMGAVMDVVLGTGPTDGAWRTVAEIGEYEGIKIAGPDGSFAVEIGSTDVKGARMRRSGKSLVEILKTAMAKPADIEADPLPFVSELLPTIGGLYAFNSATLRDLKVTAPDDVAVTLGAIETESVDSDGIGAMTLRDLDVKAGAAGSGSLDLFTVNNVRFGDLMAFVRLGKAMDGAAEGAEPDPKMVLDAVLDGSPTIDFVELSGLTVDTPMGSVGLDSFAVTSGNWYKALAQRYDTTFTRASFPSTSSPIRPPASSSPTWATSSCRSPARAR